MSHRSQMAGNHLLCKDTPLLAGGTLCGWAKSGGTLHRAAAVAETGAEL